MALSVIRISTAKRRKHIELHGNLSKLNLTPKAKLWGWLNSIFNRVDESRIKAVGADRACAEWLLRCGAHVKWRGSNSWLTDYNSLPSEDKARSLRIVEISGIDAAVMNIGFPHLNGLSSLRKISFHRCNYLEDGAIESLVKYTKGNLEELQISSNGNVTNQGLLLLKDIKTLKSLILFDLPAVKNRTELVTNLKIALPKCQIDFREVSTHKNKPKG